MRLTSLTIAPLRSWEAAGPKNPLRAVVKLHAEHSTVETVLSEDTMRLMLDLCAAEVAANAERNVREFVAAVSAVEGGKGAAMIGGLE